MNILYIDPIFGISGDMMIAAFIDAGMPFSEIDAVLRKVPLSLPRITPVELSQGVVKGVHLNIGKSDLHLSIGEMEAVISGLDIKDGIKKDALAMLDIIIEVEGKVHDIGRDALHLHELSHIDTVMDLLGVAAGMDYFAINKVYSGPVPCGRGTINTAHGAIPNPPPVTLEILRGYDLVFYDEPLELTTPTGATIIRRYVGDNRTGTPPFSFQKIGYGVGTYKSTRPDLLRLYIATDNQPVFDEDVWVVECDMDDMETEYMGLAAERIRSAGVLDLLYFPVSMKKGRPGIRLSITVTAEKLEQVVALVFRETTTFGARIRKDKRRILRREEQVVETSLGALRVKYGYKGEGAAVKTHVESEDVRKIADEHGLPYREVLETVKSEIINKK